MEKIDELEAVLKQAARLAEELNTANNALKVPGEHIAGVRSRILGAIGSLAFHKDHVQAHPETAAPTTTPTA